MCFKNHKKSSFSTVNLKKILGLPWKIAVFLLLILPFFSFSTVYAADSENSAKKFTPPAFADIAHLKNLPSLNAHSVSVAGLSSGAYMAVQYQMAFSSEVVGAGIVAGGPFYCAEGSLVRVAHNCMKANALAPAPDVKRQNENLNYFAHLGLIDNPAALKKHRVYVFGSKLDDTVYFSVIAALMDFYRAHLPKGQYLFDRHKSAAHAFISPYAASKNACERAQLPPYVNHCGTFDTAKNIFQHIYGNIQNAEANPEQPNIGTLYSFNQGDFTPDKPAAISMAERGYVYIPKTCEKENCRLMLALHGCKQNAELVGDAFIRQSGFLQWAANNRTIVLFPQTTERLGYLPLTNNTILNPYACWDWWGYTTKDFVAKNAPQLKSLHKMVHRLQGKK